MVSLHGICTLAGRLDYSDCVVHVSPKLSVQALAVKQEEEARQLHSRLQHNKQQLALYYKAQEAARAEAQAAATLQAEEEAAQVCCRVIG